MLTLGKKEYGEFKDLVKLKYFRNIGRNKISNHMKNESSELS